MRCRRPPASCAGYNLNAGRYVPAKDRGGLERLARYLLRPPLAKARLERRADGTVVLGLKRSWSAGTTAHELFASELVEKRVVILPPPRAKEVTCRGVLAANARLRRKVVPKCGRRAPIPLATAKAPVATLHPFDRGLRRGHSRALGSHRRRPQARPWAGDGARRWSARRPSRPKSGEIGGRPRTTKPRVATLWRQRTPRRSRGCCRTFPRGARSASLECRALAASARPSRWPRARRGPF